MLANIFSPDIISSVALPSSSTSLGIDGLAEVADALDNAIRADLQGISQEMFVWVIRSTKVLAFGCFLELPELLFDIWPKWFSWLTWKSKKHHDNFDKFVRIVGLLGWLLVAGGIIGEGVFESLQNRAEGQLQTFNDILLKDARLTAANARAAAREAEDSAEQLGDKVKAAQYAAEQANQSAQRAQKSAKEVSQKAIDLQYLIDMAAQELNPLDLDRSDEDRKTLFDFFQQYKGMAVTFESYVNDGEQYFLCLQLADIASSAKMSVTEKCGTWKPSATPHRGLFVSTPTRKLTETIGLFLMEHKVGRGAYAGESNPKALNMEIFLGEKYGFPTVAPKVGKSYKLTTNEIKRLRQEHP